MELHFSEPWFHRIVQGGRVVAEELLRKHSTLGDGTFLVRPSETFVGAYSLSFLRRGEVNYRCLLTYLEILEVAKVTRYLDFLFKIYHIRLMIFLNTK